MRVLMLMGRGIEGAGNTRLSIEIEEFLQGEGHEVIIIANSEKIWPRSKMHVNDIELHDFSKGPFEDDGNFDFVVVMSVPAAKFSEEGKENFTSTLEKYAQLPMSYIQVDHKLASITRNYYGKEPWTTRFFTCVDKVLTNCIKNDFLVKFVERKVDLKAVGGLKTVGIMMISADFDAIPKTDKKLPKTIHFLGRSPEWKGWPDLVQLQHDHLKSRGYTMQIEGVELSIGTVKLLFKSLQPRLPRDDLRLMSYKENAYDHMTDEGEAQVYGPYVRNAAIDRVSKSKFAAFTTYLGENFGGMIEAAFLEMAATATPIIIKEELYDAGILNHGERLNHFKPEEMGVILWNSTRPMDLVARLEELETDEDAYTQMCLNAHDFWKARFDRAVMLPQLLKEFVN